MPFLTRKQYPLPFSPTPPNCNLQLHTGFFVDPAKPLCASASLRETQPILEHELDPLILLRSPPPCHGEAAIQQRNNESFLPQRRRDAEKKQHKTKPLCASAPLRETHPILEHELDPLILLRSPPRATVKQQFHNATTKAFARRDAETRRKNNTKQNPLRLSASAGNSPHTQTRTHPKIGRAHV